MVEMLLVPKACSSPHFTPAKGCCGALDDGWRAVHVELEAYAKSGLFLVCLRWQGFLWPQGSPAGSCLEMGAGIVLRLALSRCLVSIVSCM